MGGVRVFRGRDGGAGLLMILQNLGCDIYGHRAFFRRLLFSSSLLGGLLILLGTGGLGGGGDLAAQTPEQRYFDWTNLPFPAGELANRRARVAEELSGMGGGVLVAPGGEGLSDGDTFRQDDTFWYLTGLELPRSVVAVLDDGSSVLFSPERDPRFENPSRRNDFPGRPLVADHEIARRSGFQRILPADSITPFLRRLASAGRTVYVRGSVEPASGVDLFRPSETPAERFVRYVSSTVPELTLESADGLLARTQGIKSAAEISRVRRAADLTAASILHAAAFIRDGVTERDLEAEFVTSCLRGGGQRIPFHPIIKSGPNSLWPWRVLASHYDRRNREMRDGELVIFDVGCELDYYLSDVGRTFPVSGRFSAEQRAILEMETAVADSLIAAIRPGITFSDLKTVADRVIPAGARPYMQVGLFFGHAIGLSTGDPFDATAPLQPGMVFTVEPWYYNHDQGVSVFTEDVILVTRTGAENLTASLPRAPEELERIVLQSAARR